MRFMSAGDCLTMSTAVKHDGRLLAVGCAGVNLRLPLVVVDQHVQRDGCAQLAVVRQCHRRPGEILMRWAVHCMRRIFTL